MNVTTPSGLEIRYTPSPRAYWLRAPQEYLRDDAGEWSLSYPLPGWTWEDMFEKVDDDGWVKVRSVTEVLGCLDKPALPWWGMKIGVEGVLELSMRDKINGEWLKQNAPSPHAVDAVVKMLTAEKLTVNHVRDKAGDRGTNVHSAFEAFMEHGVIPKPDLFPVEEQGYVIGLTKFIDDARFTGHVETESTEQMVGSWQFLYAGRYDWHGTLTGEFWASVPTPKGKKKRKEVTFNEDPTILDLKTSSGVYPTHFIQLEGYELARIECGYPPTTRRAVLHVTADGEYEVVENPTVTGDYFLAVRAVDNIVRRSK